MSCPHQHAQQLRELFAQLHDVVAFGFEQLQQRTQMRRRERRAAAVVRPIAVNKVVHPATEVVRMQWMEMRLMGQVVTRDRDCAANR